LNESDVCRILAAALRREPERLPTGRRLGSMDSTVVKAAAGDVPVLER